MTHSWDASVNVNTFRHMSYQISLNCQYDGEQSLTATTQPVTIFVLPTDESFNCLVKLHIN